MLGAIPYQRNEAVLHTDASLLPRRRAAWASWNYHLPDEPAGRTTLTYDMNRLQSLDADRDLLVTLNRTEAIDPAKVIRTIDYAHPVFSPEGVARPGPLGRGLGGQAHPLLRRLLALGLSRGRRLVGACGSRGRSAAAARSPRRRERRARRGPRSRVPRELPEAA